MRNVRAKAGDRYIVTGLCSIDRTETDTTSSCLKWWRDNSRGRVGNEAIKCHLLEANHSFVYAVRIFAYHESSTLRSLKPVRVGLDHLQSRSRDVARVSLTGSKFRISFQERQLGVAFAISLQGASQQGLPLQPISQCYYTGSKSKATASRIRAQTLKGMAMTTWGNAASAGRLYVARVGVMVGAIS